MQQCRVSAYCWDQPQAVQSRRQHIVPSVDRLPPQTGRCNFWRQLSSRLIMRCTIFMHSYSPATIIAMKRQWLGSGVSRIRMRTSTKPGTPQHSNAGT
jgi:hypothetical protein